MTKTVLLVEDNDDDIVLMKMACRRSGIPHLLQVVTESSKAIDYLSGNGACADWTVHPTPNLVFLDIKMPNRDGHEVLQWIRSQQRLKNLPVVMLTLSALPADMDRAYELGATSYLQKVSNIAEFGQGVRLILKYWLELNLPPS